MKTVSPVSDFVLVLWAITNLYCAQRAAWKDGREHYHGEMLLLRNTVHQAFLYLFISLFSALSKVRLERQSFTVPWFCRTPKTPKNSQSQLLLFLLSEPSEIRELLSLPNRRSCFSKKNQKTTTLETLNTGLAGEQRQNKHCCEI